MTGMTRDEAVERMLKGIEGLDANDLVEVYNELFPRTPVKHKDINGDGARLLGPILDYIHRGLELDEIMDLWPVVFSGVRSLYWDEVDEKFYPNPELQPLPDW
jgi:hypothetical protein